MSDNEEKEIKRPTKAQLVVPVITSLVGILIIFHETGAALSLGIVLMCIGLSMIQSFRLEIIDAVVNKIMDNVLFLAKREAERTIIEKAKEIGDIKPE